jgi:hypothetical protein
MKLALDACHLVYREINFVMQILSGLMAHANVHL